MGDCVRKDESKSKKQRAWKISHIQAFPKYSGAFLNTYKEMLELTFSDWSFTTHPDINKTKPFELVAIQAASKAHDSSPGQIFNRRKSVQLHYFPRHCASAATDWRAALLFLGGGWSLNRRLWQSCGVLLRWVCLFGVFWGWEGYLFEEQNLYSG